MATGAWRTPSQNRDRCGVAVAEDGWGITGIAMSSSDLQLMFFWPSLTHWMTVGHSMEDLCHFFRSIPDFQDHYIYI